ncbi:polyprenyl synthetase family protein [Pseudomonas sp.]|uniref:polyprenyl synthetase family protein n=1 Tax=Pseudomonas sp. TaxID=306 RepID=UPI002630FB2F|nr:polyprenyl synthetase family protein [Pseudomonas sp.]
MNAKAQWFEPFRYQERATGKLARTELTWALSALYGLPSAQTRVLCAAIERMNLSSLIHDDLLDGDALRRGITAVWKQYGAEVALVSGMYGYLDGLRILAELNDIQVVNAGIESLERLHVGQFLDANASAGDTLPTLEEYGRIAQANTGCFFVFPLKACQCLKALETETYTLLERMMLLMGIYYRYVNDYCDINHIPHFGKKGFAADLEGGPKSFLMILAGKALVKGPLTSEQKTHIIRSYGDAGIFDAALALMEETYGQLLDYLGAIKRRNCAFNIHALEAFLRSIHFQPEPEDNYYLQLRK